MTSSGSCCQRRARRCSNELYFDYPSHTQHAADDVIADYTLQEYLNQNMDILSLTEHADIARACLTFLSFDDFNHKPAEIWRREQFDGYRIPQYKAFPHNPYQLTFYAVRSWGSHAQMAGETEEVKIAATDFLSRPAHVAYNWLVIIRAEGWTGGSGEDFWKHVLYEDLLKDAYFFRLLLPVHFGLEGVLVELLKRHIRPAENTLDTVISCLACHAARRGYREIVRLLLTQKDVDWDICDMLGDHLLSLVTMDNLRILLHKDNCSVNATSSYGTALHKAVAWSGLPRVQALLEAGADAGGHDDYGCPVIYVAVHHYPWNESWGKMMDLLLEYNADINAHNKNGSMVLHCAMRSPYYGYAVEYLLSVGANPNLPDKLGRTPLGLIEESAVKGPDQLQSVGHHDHGMVIEILRKAGGKTAKEMSQSFIGEHGPSFPPEWMERLKSIQEMERSIVKMT